MSSVVELLRSRSRAVVLTALAVGVAGCSADSTRFDNPFASHTAPGEATGSAGQPSVRHPRHHTAGPQGPAPVRGQPPARPAAEKPGPVTAGGVPASAAAAPKQSAVHVVVAGDTLTNKSRLYHTPVNEIA